MTDEREAAATAEKQAATVDGALRALLATATDDEQRLAVVYGFAQRVGEAHERSRADIAAALRGLLGWSKLARLLDDGIAKSIDGDPAWTAARTTIEELEAGR